MYEMPLNFLWVTQRYLYVEKETKNTIQSFRHSVIMKTVNHSIYLLLHDSLIN